MTNESESAPATRPSIKRFGAATLGLLSGHVELFGVELQEQKLYGLRALVRTWLALLAGLLLAIGLSAVVLVVLWDDYRLHALIGLCFFYACALLICFWRLRVTLKAASNPFSATRAELARNRERLFP